MSERSTNELFDCRVAFADTLISLARSDPRIVAMVPDAVGSSNMAGFRARFPERFLNVGIAEQDMVGIGAGLANSGKIPFVISASCFLTGRALEQIKVDAGYARGNVKLVGMSPGLAYGALGATHHSIEDIAWLRAIANLTVIVPADPIETAQAVTAAATLEGPVFLRISRIGVPAVNGDAYRFEIGKAARLRDGRDITLIACGTMVSVALEAAGLLASQGIQARVLNLATIRPIDRSAIAQAARETGAIVTVEEHTVYGGLGSAVAEVVVTTHPVPMRILGVPGAFAPTGPVPWLFEHFGLTAAGVRDGALELLDRRTDGGQVHPGH